MFLSNRMAATALAALILGLVPSSHACSLMPGDPNITERKKRFPISLLGTVVKVDTVQACEVPTRRMYFKVKVAFGVTAKAGDTVIVGSPSSVPGCGVNYPVGREVIVFGNTPPCADPKIKAWTLNTMNNIENPMFAQIDSLGGTSSIRASRTTDVNSMPVHRRDGGRLIFSAPGGAGLEACDAEGRAINR